MDLNGADAERLPFLGYVAAAQTVLAAAAGVLIAAAWTTRESVLVGATSGT